MVSMQDVVDNNFYQEVEKRGCDVNRREADAMEITSGINHPVLYRDV